MTALDTALARIDARRIEGGRRKRREDAEHYRRDRRDLRYWMFKRLESRGAIFQAHFRPDDPASTKRLCHALYADWRAALALPQYLKHGGIRADELRTLFTCECALYLRQRQMRMAAE